MKQARRLRCLALLGMALGLTACKPTDSSSPEMVVYASQDQVYAEPILQQFETETGIRVRPVFDSEAVKTVGLANRLLAEKSHPVADVFWNNEMLRTVQLSTAGVLLSQTNRVVFGSRSRRLVLNTDRIQIQEAPTDWVDLTNSIWKGRIAMAYPLFGTTATHFLHWHQRWGESAWNDWCKALIQNKPFMVEGNSAVVQLVGRGEAWIGMTDSDDITAGQRQGFPIVSLPESVNGLRIPNSASMVAGAPHPVAAQSLLQYLARPEVIQELVRRGALESAESSSPRARSEADWNALEQNRASTTESLRNLFLR